MFKKIISAYTLLSLSEKKLVNFLGFSYGFFFLSPLIQIGILKLLLGFTLIHFTFLLMPLIHNLSTISALCIIAGNIAILIFSKSNTLKVNAWYSMFFGGVFVVISGFFGFVTPFEFSIEKTIPSPNNKAHLLILRETTYEDKVREKDAIFPGIDIYSVVMERQVPSGPAFLILKGQCETEPTIQWLTNSTLKIDQLKIDLNKSKVLYEGKCYKNSAIKIL